MPSPSKYLTESIFQQEQINSWDKIYDLPPHSSTITNNDNIPFTGNVRNRMQLFEKASTSGEGGNRNTSLTQQRSPLGQKVLDRITAAASPASKSYIRAKKYIPPSLPLVYKVFKFN